MDSLTIQSYGFSDIGQIRKKNEDVFKILEKQLIFSIADGMGGHNAGDIAAKEAVDHLFYLLTKSLNRASTSEKDAIYHIKLAIQEANYKVYNLSKRHPSLNGMGSTLCLLHINQNKAIYAHVGDSRIHHFREGQIVQLTQDHSLINRLKLTNDLKSIQKKKYKNIITKAIGILPLIEPSIDVLEFKKNDLFLLSSDGLTDYLTSDDLIKTIINFSNLKDLCNNLINKAKINGSCDNITALAVKIV